MVRPRAWRSGRARRALGGRARFLSLQFQTELRKILLSLIEVAQKLLALSPGAVELFTKANGTRPAGAGGAGTASGPRFPACGILPQHRDWEHPEHVVCLPRLLGVVPSSPSVRAGTGGRLRFSEVRVAASVRCPGEALRPGALANTPPARALPGPHRCRVSPAAMLDEDEDERVDEAALRQLTEMGFPEGRAAKALRLNQYVGPSPPGRGAWSPGAPRR